MADACSAYVSYCNAGCGDTRKDDKKMGQGSVVVCVGSRLAEMQLQILWEEILKRFSRIEVTGQPKYLNSNFIRGITDLPVTLYE